MRRLRREVREAIRRHGLRNSPLTSIAPTGTISPSAGNVSPGIEPIVAHADTRQVLQPDGARREEEVVDHAVRVWRERHGAAPLPGHMVTGQDPAPEDHVRLQAAAQRRVDASIPRTINLPADIPFEAFQEIYRPAYDTGCKGCTTYRPNAITGAMLHAAAPPAPPSTPPLSAERVPAAAPSRSSSTRRPWSTSPGRWG